MVELIWQVIPFGGGAYSVSTHGEVRSNLTGKNLCYQITNANYKIVHLYWGGHRKACTIHRLVALAFVAPVPDKNIVDHIDGDKLNNYSDNLRWTDESGNMQYAFANGLMDNAIERARERMSTIGKRYGFRNSQENLIIAKPIDLVIDDQVLSFRSLRQASGFLRIDHKTLSARIQRGWYA